MSTEVRVPTLGESVTEATVATWFKKPGDRVETDEMLCELETDKVTVEVPSPASGELSEIVAEEGATVGVDALLATIAEAGAEGGAGAADGGGGAAAAKPTEAPEPAAAPDEAAASGGGETVEVMVPALGESVTEATVSTWFKATGDAVAADEMLCELETDKVSVEVPAPAAGTLGEILAEEGTTVEAGGRLATITTGAGAAAPAPEAEAHEAPAAKAEGRDVEDAPSAKKMMEEKGLSSDQVQGTGRDGRIMKEDVQKAAAGGGAAPAAEARQPAAAPEPP
ncbi:dihydrolipoamide succinyltransferase, partial [Rhodobacteraceae bacterium WD3A24]